MTCYEYREVWGYRCPSSCPWVNEPAHLSPCIGWESICLCGCNQPLPRGKRKFVDDAHKTFYFNNKTEGKK